MTTLSMRDISLESGDRMSRDEFHRRYSARPDIKKAELVRGVVYVASPVRAKYHGKPHNLTGFWLDSYAARVPGLQTAGDSTVRLGADSELQPDHCLYWDPPRGHGAYEDDQGYLAGVPELVVEVAASSAAYDLHDKKAVYEEAGVLEYIVWRVLDEEIDWFRLVDGRYVLISPGDDGVLESAVFPGLRLPVGSLLAGDRAALLAALGFTAD